MGYLKNAMYYLSDAVALDGLELFITIWLWSENDKLIL